VAGDGEDATAVRHDDVLAFANDSEPSLLECSHRLEVRNAGDLRHYTETSTSGQPLRGMVPLPERSVEHWR
jgi:hypothetical protein